MKCKLVIKTHVNNFEAAFIGSAELKEKMAFRKTEH
jgi:hypothetical protein